MKKFSLSLLIVLSSLMAHTVYAQTLDQWITAADQAFDLKDYYSAYNYYEVATQYDTSRMDLWYKMGESAQYFTAYNKAERAYTRVGASAMRDSFPLLDFRLAQVLQLKGDYDRALNLYETYLSMEDSLADEAEKNLISCEWALDELTRKDDVAISHMGDKINSPNNDFGLYRLGDTVFFSSLRFVDKKDKVVPRRSYTKILYQVEGQEEEKVEELPSSINQDGRLAAHTAYNRQKNQVYYTLCDYEGLSSDLRCELYVSRVDAEGQWGAPKRLSINDSNATNTEPNVGYDVQADKEYLYFASDRSGGKGGLDLYRVELMTDESMGAVEALDDINSAGNDVTPFFYSPRQILYFSTDHPSLRMGGYDIYSTHWQGDGWSRPKNMGVPLNSSYNDLYYARFEDEQHAYFASNRPDSLALFWDDSKDACCNDIYKIGIVDEIKLLALTFDELDHSELAGTTVTLYRFKENGEKYAVDSLVNMIGNDFNFIVSPDEKYELVARKKGYTVAVEPLDLTDPALANEKEIEKRLYLSPGIKLDVFTFNELDSTALAGTTAFLYELTPEGDMILVDSLVNPTANDHHFMLDFNKKYQVFTRKDGYTPADTTIDTADPEIANQSVIRRDLYMKPALMLEVYAWRLRDNMPLMGTTVYLYEYTDAEGEVLVDSITNLSGHQSWFPVQKGKQYVIRGEKDGFGPAESSLDLSGDDVPDFGTYRRDLHLGQLLEIYTFDDVTELELPGAEVKLIDPVTGEVLKERINPHNNDFRFSVALDRPYRLEVTRKGYQPVSEEIAFTTADLLNSNGKKVIDIFMVPYENPASMLPLSVYYDNDHPNPRSYSPTTTLEYIETNVEYYQKKQEFIQTFTADMDLEEAFKFRREFTDFFDREVRGGRYDLEEFAKRLLVYLEAGNKFELELKGFASPRASGPYNKILSKRRIDAVVNFIERYEGGKLKAFITAGALSYKELPLGETNADPRVIDRFDDPRNSIYNVLASLERRVEISTTQTDQ